MGTAPLVFAHRGSSRPARAHPRRLPARDRRGRRRPGVRRPADPRRAPGLRARPPARPDQQRPGRVSAAHAGRAGRPRLRLLAPGQRPTATSRPTRTGPGCSRWTGCSARCWPPAGRSGCSIETKHPSRYGGDVERAAGRRCCAGTGWTEPGPDDPVTGHRDVVLPARRPPDPRAGPGAAHRAAAGGAPAGAAAGPAAVRRPDRRPGHRLVRARPQLVPRAARRPATRSTSGPSTSRTTSSWCWRSGSTGSSPTGPRFVLARLGRVTARPAVPRPRSGGHTRDMPRAHRLPPLSSPATPS